MKKDNIFIVIPVYNEGSIVGSVIDEIKKAGYEKIILVDDGSKDNTLEVQEKEIVFLRHYINRGKGAATKTGFEAVKLLGAKILVTMDGDGQHDAGDIEKLVRPIVEEECDVVLGTRKFTVGEVPRIKILYNFVGNFFTWFFYGLWVTDSQSGFRAYSKKAIDVIDTKTDRYEYDSEVIREIKKYNLKFKEIPIKVRYTTYSKSKASKQGFLNGIKTVFKMLISS
ncbi:glycosyltransferase family 2 protein [bacterium (Candidatus Howlettbacteria) CG_4_10_14_0_8_um_filter_40_9]|nr:MAG: glycosyltransferase family 2 protein [bacterium (Candidatus Howlettbacteria) CG_4_10_14_0_8_um_filter_40_9]